MSSIFTDLLAFIFAIVVVYDFCSQIDLFQSLPVYIETLPGSGFQIVMAVAHFRCLVCLLFLKSGYPWVLV